MGRRKKLTEAEIENTQTTLTIEDSNQAESEEAELLAETDSEVIAEETPAEEEEKEETEAVTEEVLAEESGKKPRKPRKPRAKKVETVAVAEEKAEVKTEERKASDDSEAKEAKAEEKPKVEDSKKEAKRAKEEARLSESWKKLEAEKAQVRARQAELEKKIEELESKNDPTSPSPDALRKYAREWENEGRDDLAKAARQQADLLEQKAKSQSEKEERQKREFTEQWGSSVRRMIEENPELKDEESPFAKRVVSLLKSEDAELRKLLNTSPNGFAYATQIARMQEAAEASEALRKEVETLRKENTEFRKKTSLSASSTAKAPKRKSFEEMSWSEQEEFLRRNASDADKLGVLVGD
jgi:cell division protein FtsB